MNVFYSLLYMNEDRSCCIIRHKDCIADSDGHACLTLYIACSIIK